MNKLQKRLVSSILCLVLACSGISFLLISVVAQRADSSISVANSFDAVASTEQESTGIAGYNIDLSDKGETVSNVPDAVEDNDVLLTDTTITVRDIEEDDKNILNGAVSYAYGTLNFLDEKGNKTPLRYTRVEIWDENVGFGLLDAFKAGGYTDIYGKFYFNFKNADVWKGADIYLRVYAEGATIKVTNILRLIGAVTTTVDDVAYYGRTSTIQNIQDYKEYKIDVDIPYHDDSYTDNDSKFYQAIYVSQGMILSQQFAKQMGTAFSSSRKLVVIYPFPADTSFCFGSNNMADLYYQFIQVLTHYGVAASSIIAAIALYLVNDIGINGVSGISNTAFDNLNTLTHEYGHYVQGILGIYGSNLVDIIQNDPTHRSDTDHFNDKKDKQFAMHLTWSEAWATAFGHIAQQYHYYTYSNIINLTEYKYYEDFSIDSDRQKANAGEAQEDAVIASLIDLYDETNETGDSVYFGYQKWWDITTLKGTYTLTDFANTMDKYVEYRSGFGAILGKHQIAPSYIKFSITMLKLTSLLRHRLYSGL